MTTTLRDPLPTPPGVPGTAAEVRAGRRTAAGTAAELLADTATAPGLLAVDAEPLRAAAAALDRRTDRFALPLAGVLVAVEEGISTAGRGDEPVRRLRAAGALVAGRARTAEFGIGADGSPGGRATAAAVAAGLVPLGVGIDGDGALRAAAAAHGLAALKPGRRVLPLPAGAERRWAGLAETTIVAAGPDDLRAALDVLTAPARRTPGTAPAPSRSAGPILSSGLGPAQRAPAAGDAMPDEVAPLGSLACSLRTGRTALADPAPAAALHAAIRVLGTAGVRLLAADPPYRAVLGLHGARRRHAGLARRVAELELDPSGLPSAARAAVRRGRRVRRLGGPRPATPASWRQRMIAWLDDAGTEAGLLPAGSGAAAAGSTGLAAWNLAGLPSLVTPVPAGGGRACVQLVGRPGSERRLLATAALLTATR